MLKEYLVVAQEALEAKKEMYLVKQQRLELAQQEMLLFHELSEDNRSIASSKFRSIENLPNSSSAPPCLLSNPPTTAATRTVSGRHPARVKRPGDDTGSRPFLQSCAF